MSASWISWHGITHSSFRTKDRYYQAMNRSCAYLAEEYRFQKLANISGKHLTSYVIWMQKNGKDASTIKTDLAALMPPSMIYGIAAQLLPLAPAMTSRRFKAILDTPQRLSLWMFTDM